MKKFLSAVYQIVTSRKFKILASISLLLGLSLELAYLWGIFNDSSEYIQRRNVSIVVLLVIYFHLALFGVLFHRELFRVIKKFFTEKTHPINLAVFRIVLFGFLLTWPFPSENNLKLINLRFSPDGMAWALKYHLIRGDVVILAIGLFRFFCLTSCIGFFTRVSTVMATVCGVYAMGAAQFLGKVNHYHHLVWFMAILAASRCADALSVDAFLAVWQRGKGKIIEPKAEVYYATPLRVTWLLLGVLYFFPGFWKVMNGGLDWFLSDNLKYHLYHKWYEIMNFNPPFRIDQYPLVFKSSAFGVVFFELSFVFFVLFPQTRWFAAIGGIIFHNMTNLFMKISFFSLQICYVVFFDWRNIFQKIGKRVYKEELLVFYNKDSLQSTRKANVVKTIDIFGRMRCLNKKTKDSPDGIVVAVGNDIYSGHAVNKMIAVYSPFLWLLLPFFFLSGVPLFISKAFVKIDELLAGTFGSPTYHLKSNFAKKKKKAYAVMLVGLVLLVGNIYCGYNRYHSWPFTAYPAFSSLMRNPYVFYISPVAFDAKNEIILFNEEEQASHLSRARLLTLHRKILYQWDNEIRKERLFSLWKVWQGKEEKLKHAKKVIFYLDEFTTVPEEMHRNPVRRRLLLTIDLE